MTSTETDLELGAHIDRLLAARQLTERLAEPLSAEDQTVQSMPDTSPTKWHRAHTTWFFETFVLSPYVPNYRTFDPYYDYLFNSYYEAVGDRYPRASRGLVTRPGAADIGSYRRYVDQALASLVDAERDVVDAVRPLIELGIHHEQQHQELILMDIKHVLANNTFSTAYLERPPVEAADPGELAWHHFEGGIVDVGVADESETFRFDNEGPLHQTLVGPFDLANRLVTCGEWQDFIDDGGYDEATLWLSDGWYTRQSEGWSAPLYWDVDRDGARILHTLHGPHPLDRNEPVCHVSFYEADAFATWAGARLPTEIEWEVAAGATPSARGELVEYADLDLDELAAANTFHPSGAAPGPDMAQLFGDCWEWTGSPYRPYPGYRIPEGAIGEYNGKFMINTMVLRGGSAFTPADHIRSTYRNFFHPHTRWHLSGLRLARD